MPKWEYKLFTRTRGTKDRAKDELWHWAADWDAWHEDDTKHQGSINLVQKLRELGDQGWELVEIVARSGIAGGVSTTSGFVAFGGGKTEGYSTDLAGFTNSETWVFKRQKN